VGSGTSAGVNEYRWTIAEQRGDATHTTTSGNNPSLPMNITIDGWSN
jgi:hypothetical protein